MPETPETSAFWDDPRLRLGFLGLAVIFITAGAPAALKFSDSPFIALMLAHACLAMAAMRLAAVHPGRGVLLIIFAVALLLRLMLLFETPLLSTDVYRYIWDGRVVNAGFNPFTHIPAEPALAALRDTAVYPNVDKRDYAVSIYPPVAQFIFAATVWISDGLLAMKAAMLLFEAAAVAAVLYLLGRLGKPRALIVGYLWHPAALWEIANNAHADAAMMALVFAAFAVGAGKARSYVAGAMLALAALVKPTAALALPTLWRPWDIKLPAFVLGLALLCYVPFLSAGTGVLGFLGTYFKEQRFDTGSSFYLVNLINGPGPPALWLTLAYYALAAAALTALMLRASLRAERSLETSLRDTAWIMITFLFFLSPDFPWYYLVLLPFVPLTGSWSAFAMTSAGFLLNDVTVDDYSLSFFIRGSIFNALVFAAILYDLGRSMIRRRAGAGA